jgi:uncharacterized protein (DUF1778 family)
LAGSGALGIVYVFVSEKKTLTLQIPLSPDFEARLGEQAAVAGKDITRFLVNAVNERTGVASQSA